MAILNGTDFSDFLVGVQGESNIINLNKGNDTGIGAGLDDTINGGEGNDILIGGGNDPNVRGWAPANDVLNGNEGQDLLLSGIGVLLADGTGVETLDVSGVVILNAGDLNNGNNDQGDGDFDQIVLAGNELPPNTLDKESLGDSFVHFDEDGNNDYAIINNFESGIDKIVVSDDLENYRFGASPFNSNRDTNALFYKNDLIAVIDNAGTELASVTDLATSMDLDPFKDQLGI